MKKVQNNKNLQLPCPCQPFPHFRQNLVEDTKSCKFKVDLKTLQWAQTMLGWLAC